MTIEGVYLQGEADEDAERVWLTEDPMTTDLLTLANDAVALVEDAEVPAGSYAQLRFVISGGYIEVEGDEGATRIFASPGYDEVPVDRTVDGTLLMPSFAQSGLKVNLPDGGVQVNGDESSLLVDFSVAESFGQEAGASGMWVMHPVIQAVALETSSTISVRLALGEGVELPEGVTLADFAAHIEGEGGSTKEDSFVESDGEYTASFMYLLPEVTWSLTLDVPEGVSIETDLVFPQEVETVSGTDVAVEITITSAGEASEGT